MNIHEYQAKHLMAEYGIPVPVGKTVFSTKEVSAAARELGGDRWVVKAQVHAGGRGKAGGVKIVDGPAALENVARELLGSRLVTHQSGADGQPVERLLIEQLCDISRELYLACLVDRGLERIVFIVSSEGGMDIEEVAATHPDRILSVSIDPVAGLQGYQCREIAFRLGMEGKQIVSLTKIMSRIFRLFVDKDLGLVEINPLVVTKDGALLALDAKINVDDSALYRQPDLESLQDSAQEDPREHKAQTFGLNYVALDGNIGCMVNGAGLAMATMDLIKLQGGRPANFLDVGGGTTADRVAEALKIILSDDKVKAVLVNIFGGIVRCDLIAEGIIAAVQEIKTTVSIIVRLEGTNVDKGRELLEHSNLKIITAPDLTQAARQAVVQAGK
ncbi:MAG: ADP-forming succinate--CoA ligase subunit beta [Gammaproteobacteria bacterium]|nr:MAG: ADP-forming succinate--CoA ligase subunit beta [Gammaproteobacteria bacterium]